LVVGRSPPTRRLYNVGASGVNSPGTKPPPPPIAAFTPVMAPMSRWKRKRTVDIASGSAPSGRKVQGHVARMIDALVTSIRDAIASLAEAQART
jgi:hypothetical protein